MSLMASAEREARCDFPDCKKQFDQQKGAKCAKKKGEEIIAFCEVHSERLAKEGVILYTLREVNGTDKKERETRERAEREHAQRESDFIKSLK